MPDSPAALVLRLADACIIVYDASDASTLRTAQEALHCWCQAKGIDVSSINAEGEEEEEEREEEDYIEGDEDHRGEEERGGKGKIGRQGEAEETGTRESGKMKSASAGAASERDFVVGRTRIANEGGEGRNGAEAEASAGATGMSPLSSNDISIQPRHAAARAAILGVAVVANKTDRLRANRVALL